MTTLNDNYNALKSLVDTHVHTCGKLLTVAWTGQEYSLRCVLHQFVPESEAVKPGNRGEERIRGIARSQGATPDEAEAEVQHVLHVEETGSGIDADYEAWVADARPIFKEGDRD